MITVKVRTNKGIENNVCCTEETILVYSILQYEFFKLYREQNTYIVNLLKNIDKIESELLNIFRHSSLTKETIYDNFSFGSNGKIKASHDNEGDGIVKLQFMDFIDYTIDGDSDWTWSSQHYDFPSFDSGWSEYMGLIFIQTMELKYGNNKKSSILLIGTISKTLHS